MIPYFLRLAHRHQSLIKFGITGVSATIIHYVAANIAFSQFHIASQLSNIIGYFTGFFCSYFGNKYWSFASEGNDTPALKTLFKFVLVWVIAFFTNQGIFALASQVFLLPFNGALTAGVIVAAMLSYLCNKLYVFR